MGIRVIELIPTGNVVASAWSTNDLVALVMRSGYAGAVRAFVLDAREGYRVISSFALPSFAQDERALTCAFPAAREDVLITSDGATASAWNARTGEAIASRSLTAEGEHGHAAAVLPDGRVLLRVRGRSGPSLRLIGVAGGDESLPALAENDVVLPFDDGSFLTFRYEGWEKGGLLARVDREGVARWEARMTQNLLLFHVDEGRVDRAEVHADDVPRPSVITLGHGRLRLTVRSAASGAIEGELELEDTARAADFGPLGQGLFVMRGRGELVFYDGALTKTRSLPLERLGMHMTVSPDETRGVVHVDRLELESEAVIVDLRDGAVLLETRRSFGPTVAARGRTELWIGGEGGLVRIGEADASLTVVHGKRVASLAVAQTGDVVVFASMGKIFTVDRAGKTKPKVIDKYFGTPQVAVSRDGKHALVREETYVRLLDVAGAKRIFSHPVAAIEEELEALDEVFFDDEGKPAARHDEQAIRLTPSSLGGAASLPKPASWRVAVGLDDAVSVVDAQGKTHVRIHLAPNGKSGIVEDGAHLDWLGAPAQAKQARGVLSGDKLLHGKALDAVQRAGLLVTTCAHLRMRG